MTWTRFMDMHSGGGQKLQWSHIYIEAPEAEAAVIFEAAFDRDPHHTTCDCCGPDYSLDESVSLEQASGFDRGCRHLETPRLPNGLFDNNNHVILAHLYLEDGEEPPPGFAVSSLTRWRDKYVPLAEYIKRPDIRVIPASEIRPEWRK